MMAKEMIIYSKSVYMEKMFNYTAPRCETIELAARTVICVSGAEPEGFSYDSGRNDYEF